MASNKFRWQKRRITREGTGRGGTRRERIRIPQPKDRVFSFRGKDVIRENLIRSSPWWFTLHRRGLQRPVIGLDPLEVRAVPRWQIVGFLRERIVWRWLVEKGHLVPDIDFEFQSSMLGGRMEFGGIVVDFIFRNKKIALQVQGPTHKETLRIAKDEEQRLILAQWGYRVVNLPIEIIDNENEFENFMRKLMNFYSMGAGGPEFASQSPVNEEHASQEDYTMIHDTLQDILDILR